MGSFLLRLFERGIIIFNDRKGKKQTTYGAVRSMNHYFHLYTRTVAGERTDELSNPWSFRVASRWTS